MTDSIDEIISRIKNSLLLPSEKRIILFEEIYNPLHFYCRLKDCGVDTENSQSWSMLYEQNIYNPVIYDIRKANKNR